MFCTIDNYIKILKVNIDVGEHGDKYVKTTRIVLDSNNYFWILWRRILTTAKTVVLYCTVLYCTDCWTDSHTNYQKLRFLVNFLWTLNTSLWRTLPTLSFTSINHKNIKTQNTDKVLSMSQSEFWCSFCFLISKLSDQLKYFTFYCDIFNTF